MDHRILQTQVSDRDGRRALERLAMEKVREEDMARQGHAEGVRIGVEWARDEAGCYELRDFISESAVPPSLARRLGAIETTHPAIQQGVLDGARAIWSYVEPGLGYPPRLSYPPERAALGQQSTT